MPCLPILSAVIFKALIIIALVPLELPGVGYRPAPAAELLSRNLLIYGIVLPFIGMANHFERNCVVPTQGQRSAEYRSPGVQSGGLCS